MIELFLICGIAASMFVLSFSGDDEVLTYILLYLSPKLLSNEIPHS